MRWTLRRVQSWKVLALATVLGAPWGALMMVILAAGSGALPNSDHLERFVYLTALGVGLVTGPILVLVIDLIVAFLAWRQRA